MRLLIAAIVLVAGVLHAAESPLDDVRPFLAEFCIGCHGPDEQENGLRFDTLDGDLAKVESLEVWQAILDQLNLGEMPPAESPQPERPETAKLVETLTAELRRAYAAHRSTGGRTVARRLNRFELRNTIRDLLHLEDPELRIGNVARLVDESGNGSVERTSTDPFRAFPADEEIEGLDNIGDRLVMSDFLLGLMLDAAEESLALATRTGPRPNVETRRFAGHVQRQPRGEVDRLARERRPDVDVYFRRETITPDPLRGGVGTSARYRLTIEVSGHRQRHPWGEFLKADQDEPFWLNLRLFKLRSRSDQIPLRRIALPGDGKRRTFTVETWIDARWTPQLIWENGPNDREARTDQLVRTFLPDRWREPPDRKTFPDNKAYDAARKEWQRAMATTLYDHYRGPSLHVHSITLEPMLDEWPPASHTSLYGEGPFDPEQVEPLLHAFARRAFRRPVAHEEIAPYVELVRSRLAPEETPTPHRVRELTFEAYEGSWTKLPDFSKLEPKRSGKVEDGLVDLRFSTKDEHFGLVFAGKLPVAEAAEYEFAIASDDGCRLSVGEAVVVEHDGLHGASLRKGRVRLEPGEHAIRIEYFAYGKPNSLRASWSGPGFREAPLAAATVPNHEPSEVDTETARAIAAMQVGYAAMLCSPDFLYLREKGGPLDDHAVAARLGYFLWSSMPDEELSQLADTGRLRDPKVLDQQVERMLADPRAAAFSRHFTERWLRLDKLAESPPELNGPFRIYWDRRMEPLIVAQTDAFFADLVRTNGPVRLLIDSDHTFLNESIANVFYGRDDVRGEWIRRVPTNDPRRGGILVQPSVMTATANGVDTSPVVRGVWVLENVLGTPPAPPPPDVEPLSPDLRNARTIREQLEVHRAQEACRSCHAKIDPLGFAFENFDPIGRWRDRYRSGPIDPSSTLSNGREVADIVALKRLLLEREEQVARCLTEKLLVYATGRLLEATDRGDVDEILRNVRAEGGGIRDIVRHVVRSRAFREK